MLPRSRRLTRRLFDEIRKSPLTFSQGPVSLRCMLGNTPGGRFSAVVPKSVAQDAVTRNKIRRQVYSVLFPLSTNLNGIFYVREAVSAKLLKENIEALLVRAQRAKEASLK